MVVSEAVNTNTNTNTNTRNFVVGFAVPAPLIGLGSPTRFAVLGLRWLVGSTLLALDLMLRGRLGPSEGIVVVGMWAAVAAATIATAP